MALGIEYNTLYEAIKARLLTESFLSTNDSVERAYHIVTTEECQMLPL